MKLIKKIMQWPLWIRYTTLCLIVIGSTYLMVFITVTQYFERGVVRIDNLCSMAVDSVQVRINNHAHTIAPVAAGQAVYWRFKKRYALSPHDVVYTMKGYRNNAVLFDHSFFSNDLGYVPDSFKVRITDSMGIEAF